MITLSTSLILIKIFPKRKELIEQGIYTSSPHLLSKYFLTNSPRQSYWIHPITFFFFTPILFGVIWFLGHVVMGKLIIVILSLHLILNVLMALKLKIEDIEKMNIYISPSNISSSIQVTLKNKLIEKIMFRYPIILFFICSCSALFLGTVMLIIDGSMGTIGNTLAAVFLIAMTIGLFLYVKKYLTKHD